ncbi:hypothetical protein EJ357_24285 [Streptomyces cyaneochromogenes]|uniref:Lipoprotein n=1 Tax=Streptomyces cyaneochromogenes TaxID=2496836 RepID=A0A3S9MN07_9ACTN|nr:hypothetical protein [Streptomyces cyaneochromogenes]AZQ40558.1 hypothetical protein EJ357_24285 [Streptomyces cyaneochromogenes]
MNRHLRNAVVATAAITAGLLMTACQNGTDDSASGTSGKGAAGATAVAEKASDSQGSKDSQNSQNSKSSKGVSGSFTNGEVSYLAPGKYIVSVPGKGDQQFWVADDTEVYGVGTICGEAGSKVDAPCTLDQLETAAKKAAVNADVEMRNGVATLVTERRAAQQDADSGETVVDGINKGKGVNGTWFGNVSYLAPGKYTVSDLKGVEQQFFLAEDTRIWGYGDVCGDTNTDEGGQGGTECTEAELEAAAKKGFTAEVVISNGIATTIRDDH